MSVIPRRLLDSGYMSLIFPEPIMTSCWLAADKNDVQLLTVTIEEETVKLLFHATTRGTLCQRYARRVFIVVMSLLASGRLHLGCADGHQSFLMLSHEEVNVPSYLMKLCILSGITGTTSTAVRRSVPSLPPIDHPSTILPSTMLMVLFFRVSLRMGHAGLKEDLLFALSISATVTPWSRTPPTT